MRLIDADRLLQHTKFYNLKNGNRAIDEIDILHAQTVKAIPLDKVKQAREYIGQLKHKNTDVEGYRWWNNAIENCLHEIDRLIAESEG